MAHPDLDAILNALIPFAQQMLSKHGEFYPFGATMSSTGEIAHVASAMEGDDHPPSQPLIDQLSEGLKQQAQQGQIRAAGICYDVRIVPPGRDKKSDAICCSLEHHLGGSVDVFLPYTKGIDGNIEFGEIFAAKRAATLFAN